MAAITRRATGLLLGAALALRPWRALAYRSETAGGNVFMPTDKGLDGATLLIVRHGEKDGLGAGLSPAGERRAAAYAHYFNRFKLDGKRIQIDALVASEDTERSNRPRLTLEPLGDRMGLVIYQPTPAHEVDDLVAWLRGRPADRTTLISWHHTRIGALVAALGADPLWFLPEGRWPNDVFDWVLVFRFDAEGRVIRSASMLVKEPDRVNNQVWATVDQVANQPIGQGDAAPK